MFRPKLKPADQGTNSLPKSRNATGKLKHFRPLPYHIALSRAARFEAWTQDIGEVGVVVEAVDSSDFDPKLMEW